MIFIRASVSLYPYSVAPGGRWAGTDLASMSEVGRLTVMAPPNSWRELEGALCTLVMAMICKLRFFLVGFDSVKMSVPWSGDARTSYIDVAHLSVHGTSLLPVAPRRATDILAQGTGKLRSYTTRSDRCCACCDRFGVPSVVPHEASYPPQGKRTAISYRALDARGRRTPYMVRSDVQLALIIPPRTRALRES